MCAGRLGAFSADVRDEGARGHKRRETIRSGAEAVVCLLWRKVESGVRRSSGSGSGCVGLLGGRAG